MNSLPQKLDRLRLTAMIRHLEQTITESATANLSVSATLERLVDLELEARRLRSVERNVKMSRLHLAQSIDAFQFNYHKSRQQAKMRILKLLDLDFLRQGANLVFVGNPGVGKTMLAKIIGWRACQGNHRVLYTTAMDMLNHLLASQVDHTLVRKLRLYTDPALLICDELGYLALDQHNSNLLYQVISARHAAKRSTLITTNLLCGAPHNRFNAESGFMLSPDSESGSLSIRLSASHFA